jgi:hypothetical protein
MAVPISAVAPCLEETVTRTFIVKSLLHES